MLLLPADSTILVCTRGPLVYVGHYNGTLRTGIFHDYKILRINAPTGVSFHYKLYINFRSSGNQEILCEQYFVSLILNPQWMMLMMNNCWND
jgi:hypothetical protein